MVKPEKVAQVEEYAELLKGAKSVYLADYMGLSVSGMEELRAKCREKGVSVLVVKNRLMNRAAADAGFEALGEHLKGPTAIAYSSEDEVAPAKLISDFAKVNELPTLKAAVVDGQVYGTEDAQAFAKLPSLEEMRATVLRTIAAPATQLVRIIAAPPTQIARVIDARKDTLSE